ncbi:Kinetochore-associated protein 1 [Pseudolycoriella hygida]|uniref:Kinetochore-associated protein 1 n=1 Tax=Pseudolycoriella hygida TaxID=35572 RepID=A0A9Q0MXW0_9DIPT|nr:Kinetochore-associated protein 1 [Pseudolycoriella hygida]
MNWNLISSNLDDETITNVFHKNHHFKLTPDAALNGPINVSAIVRNHRIIISVDSNIFLLENEDTIECNSFCFESEIDAIQLSASGLVVICALKCGDIHGLHIKGHQLFHVSVCDGDISPNKTFVGIIQTQHDYICMCSTGSVYRLSNIDEHTLPDVATFNSETTMDMSGVQLSKVGDETCNHNINTFCIVPSCRGDLIVSCSKRYLFIEGNGKKRKIRIPATIESFKSIYYLEHYLIGLSSTGELFDICLLTKSFRLFAEWDNFIKDIVILQSGGSDVQLLLETNTNGGCELRIVDFPSMKCNYELPIPLNTHLVNQSQSSANLYYLEEILRPDNVPQEVIMNLITESQPIERLKKLIRIGRLDEAETFARQLNLSDEPIHEARLRRLLIEIGSIPKETKKFEEKQSLLLDLVKKMVKTCKNTKFLISLRCSEVTDKETIRKLLSILLENVDFKKSEAELLDIKEQLLRLDTLELIDPLELEFNWPYFVHHPNLFKLITKIMNKNIDAACCIWKRHSSSLISRINVDFIQTSVSLEPLQVIQWYRHFAPCIIQNHPQSMSKLIDNVIDKMTCLQYLPDFPEIGITFIRDVAEIFSEVQFLFANVKRNFDGCMAKLSTTIADLQSLSVLKRTYNITLMYDDYVNNTIEENAFNILLRVHLNHLKDLAKNFLFPLFFKKGMLPSDCIIGYVKFLIKCHKNIDLWQERAVAVLDLVYNTEDKLECALNILRVAPVPWSETVTSLLKLGASSHPLAAEIYNEYELQHLKILKIKYGWEANSPNNILKLAFRIIKVDANQIDDIRYLVKMDSTRSFAINSYYVTTLLQQNRIDKCFEYMNLLTDLECEQVLEFIVNTGDDLLANIELMHEFYKYCSQRVNNKTLLKDALSCRKLRSSFQLELLPTDLSYPDVRYDHFTAGIKAILNELGSKESYIIDSCYKKVMLLTDSLNFDSMKGIVELSKLVNNIHFTCGMAKTVLQINLIDEHNCKYFADLAALLIGQQIKSLEIDANQAENFSYYLAYELLQKSLKYSKVFYREISEMISWCRIGCDIYSVTEMDNFLKCKVEFDRNLLQDTLSETSNNSNDSFSMFESVRSPSCVEKPTNCNEEVLKCLSSAIHVVCTMDNNPFERINSHFEFSKDDKGAIAKTFKSSLDDLVSKKLDTAYKIMHLILKYQNYLIAILMSDSTPMELVAYMNKKLKNTSNYVNFLKLCEAGSLLAGSDFNITPISIFKFQYNKELRKHDPTIQLQTNIDFQSFDNVLNALQNKVIDVSLLKEMSEAFNWSYQEVLVTQILAILRSEELDYSIKINDFGEEELITKNSIERLCNLCEIYINELTSHDHLVKELINFTKTINFYFYEIFLCVIHILQQIKVLQPDMNWWLGILRLMKHKMIGKRRSQTGQLENETWLAFNPSSGVPPPISKYRIPFLLAVNKTLEEILRDEINIEDFDKWYELIQMHAQMTGEGDEEKTSEIHDNLCMLALKNSIAENQNKFKTDATSYSFHPKNNEFLQSVLRMTKKMIDKCNILYALHFATKFAAEGADQVEAAYECYTFAINNDAELMTNRRAGSISSQIKRIYPIYKSKFLLRLHNLLDDKFNELLEKPEDLIYELYEHDSILNDQKLNINKLVEDIAELHNKNLREIQLNILHKWFCDTVKDPVSADETLYEQIDEMSDVDPQNVEVITRACYILSHWSPAEAFDFCIKYLDQSSAAKKLLAFECYMKLSNEENEIFPCNQFIQIKCAYFLKQLGFKCNDQTFNNMTKNEKIELLKKIWRKHACDPKALEVIVLICVGYEIYHPKLWSSVLKQMVNLKMTNRLTAVTELLSGHSELRQADDAFAVAWRYLIEKPFECATKTRSPEQDARLIKSLFLCQTCPVVSKIDLVSIARQFVFLQRTYMAGALLVFSNEEQKSSIKEMINASPEPLLKEDLMSLSECGIYSFIIDYAVEELEL